MILQALCSYYGRMIADPQSSMPPPGFSTENISFALSLRPGGALARLVDLREEGKKKPGPRRLNVPAAAKKTAKEDPNFLWGNSAYVLGVDSKGKPQRTAKCFAAFKQRHVEAAKLSGQLQLQAVAAFLSAWEPAQFTDVFDKETQAALLEANCVFMWDPTGDLIHEDPEIERFMTSRRKAAEQGASLSQCLVSGRPGVIARLHPSIKGVWRGQSSGGSLVSFNLEAFTSYGKEQSYNAPVSEAAAAAYVAALNYLLRREHKRCLQIGDASTVFWAEKPTPGEEWLYWLLDGGLEEDQEPPPDQGESRAERKTASQVRELLKALTDGQPFAAALAGAKAPPDIDPGIRFYILGLAPNTARISIRLWQVSTFGDLAVNIARHQADIAIEPQYENDPQFPSLWRLLLETAVQRKSENIPPTLAAGLARAMLSGGCYPQALFSAVMGRIRADKQINYIRAALIKGCLTRNYHKEVSFMLDETRQDSPYLLGRLFALLEKAQADAQGSVNATIRDRYIGAASATPALVFPRLLRLAQHHLAKSEYGPALERRIAEVMQNLNAFDAHLSLAEQGVFFIGYYHQRNANFKKTVKVEE